MDRLFDPLNYLGSSSANDRFPSCKLCACAINLSNAPPVIEMPFADLSDVRIHYSLTGPESAPVLVLSNSLGASFSMWDPQLPVFNSHSGFFATYAWPRPSSVTPGPIPSSFSQTMSCISRRLRIDRAHFCGPLMADKSPMLGIHARSAFADSFSATRAQKSALQTAGTRESVPFSPAG